LPEWIFRLSKFAIFTDQSCNGLLPMVEYMPLARRPSLSLSFS
jgi:hypothetical protein